MYVNKQYDVDDDEMKMTDDDENDKIFAFTTRWRQ